MNEKKKKIELFRKLGVSLCKRGQWFLCHAFHLKPQKVNSKELESFVSDITGLDKKSISMYDKEYYLTDWETMKQIIDYDWTESYEYKVDKFDCDNFANAFASHLAEIYGLNCVGRFSNAIYSVKTGKLLGYHRANIIAVLKNGALETYCFEPESDGFVKIEKGKPVVIGNWEYRVSYISFN